MDSDQIKVINPKSDIGFGANNRIDVIDSNIGNKNIKFSFLATNELNIVNSKIIGNEVECKSKTINADERSSLIAKDKVNLQIDNFNSININAPTIILNGEETSNEKKSIVLQKITEPLTLKRLELVNLLKKIKSQCKNISCEKVLEYEEQLKVQPISKTLKK